MRKRFQADEYGQRMEGDGQVENNSHLPMSHDKAQPINGVHSTSQGFDACNKEKYSGCNNNQSRPLCTEAENGNKSKTPSLLPDVARHFSKPLSYEESKQSCSQNAGYIRYLSKNSHNAGLNTLNLQQERPNSGNNSSYKENNILINDDDEMLLPQNSMVNGHSKTGMDNPVALGPDQGYPKDSECRRGPNNVLMRSSVNVNSKMAGHGWTDEKAASHQYRNGTDRNKMATNGNNNQSQMREVWTKLYGKTSSREETSFNSTLQSPHHPAQAFSVGHLKSTDNLTPHISTVAPANENHTMKSDVSTVHRRPGHGSLQLDQPNSVHNLSTTRTRPETPKDEQKEEKVHGLKVNYQPASMTSSDIIFLDVMNGTKYNPEEHNQKGILNRKNFPLPRNKTLFANFSPALCDQNKNQYAQNPAYNNIEGSDQSILDINDSIFDYSATGSVSEHSSLSTNLPVVPVLSSSASSTHGSKSASPDGSQSIMDKAANSISLDERKPLHTKMTQRPEKSSWLENRDAGLHVNFSVQNKRIPVFSARHSQQSQKDACTDDGSMSFDIDDTILTVESIESDTERLKIQMSAGMTNSHVSNMDDVKEQLDHLTFMYQQLFQLMSQKQKSQIPIDPPWSITSSNTNSMKKASYLQRRKSMRSTILETKHNKKHFQRLEAHVVTLVRGVATLNAQVRTHSNALKQIDILKEELQNVKTTLSDGNNFVGFPTLHNNQNEYERFRGWIPSLTNPRRVQKLTKFFGQEPPLLEIFLKKLGYERYLSNFSNEHIGMLELPYMTEERLQSIGIPMGPRLRILQESQLCFRQENFNIYII